VPGRADRQGSSGLAILARQIEEDSLRIAQGVVAIDQCRDLAQRANRKEVWLWPAPFEQVDALGGERQTQ
jgi:hypothetical protein